MPYTRHLLAASALALSSPVQAGMHDPAFRIPAKPITHERVPSALNDGQLHRQRPFEPLLRKEAPPPPPRDNAKPGETYPCLVNERGMVRCVRMER